ncbi:MAG: sigma-70 family RNA polymerase sigma factor [Gemmatimonadota bacterium]
MAETDGLAAQFEAHRVHLRRVAYRMLGAPSEADDAVQEAWLRVSRSDTSDVANLGGWLTTVVARICLDHLRARTARREESLDVRPPETPAGDGTGGDAERDLLLADSVGLAMLVVLERLTPPERVAFVLHDMFDLSFEEIAPIVRRSAPATRQLASRARRRVQGAPESPDNDRGRQQALVEAFLAASREGNFEALLAVLDPEVVLHADGAAVRMGAAAEVRGREAVANTFKGRAQVAVPALLDGEVGLMWAPGGTPRVAFRLTMVDGAIVAIELVADAEELSRLEWAALPPHPA